LLGLVAAGEALLLVVLRELLLRVAALAAQTKTLLAFLEPQTLVVVVVRGQVPI
jgi:hypothetical protein